MNVGEKYIIEIAEITTGAESGNKKARKTKIVLCPTLRRAFYEWHRLADTYSDVWADVCRKPMSLQKMKRIN